MTKHTETTILTAKGTGGGGLQQPSEISPKSAPPGSYVVIVGSTAVGKTAAAVALARAVGGEVVSADSMQVYRFMDIGTAKPTAEERAGVPFHLVDITTPDKQLTVAEWRSHAVAAIAEIRGRGRCPIVCGGTGLYVRALTHNWSLARTAADPALRSELEQRAAASAAGALHAELTRVDPVTARRLHPNDRVRLVRALEVYYGTGVPLSAQLSEDRAAKMDPSVRMFGVALPRAAVYQRVDDRVDRMIASGLEAEVRGLIDRGLDEKLGAMRSLGYREMVQHVRGSCGLGDTVSAIKQNTRRYAKRQQTWFGADTAVEWVDASGLSPEEVAARMLTALESTAARSAGD